MRTHRLIIIAIAAALSLLSGRTAALYLSLDFALDNQTYSWADSLMFERSLNSSTDLQLWNRSTATLIKESVFGAGEDRWQKLSRSAARVTRRVSESAFVGLELRQDFERLEKRRYIGNGAYLTGVVNVGGMKLDQKGGVVWEQREYDTEESVQSGFGYESALDFKPRVDGSLGRITLAGDITTFERTPQKNIKLGYSLVRSFTGRDTTTLHAAQSFGETKYFQSSRSYESTARQRNEQREFDFDLRRELPAAVYLQTRAAYRLASYDYEFDDAVNELARQSDNLRSLLEYRIDLSRAFGERFQLSSEYLYNRSKEDFGTQQVNQKSETGQLSVDARVAFFEADTIRASAKIGVTSYLAPSGSEIFSDRDRTIKFVSFRATHRFTPFLSSNLDGSFRGFHTIYLSGNLSANNNINNIFILNPSLTWEPITGLTIEHDYQLHADYIYYDFEKSSLAGRNTLYRRANFSNRCILASSPKTDFTFEYSYRYEDFGPIRYTDQWQQQVSWDRRTHRPKFGIDYHPSRSFRFQPYVVYEVQRSYDHLFNEENTLGRREQSEEFVRKLVGFDLELALTEASYIECKLERRVQEYQNQRNQDYDMFTIAVKKRL